MPFTFAVDDTDEVKITVIQRDFPNNEVKTKAHALGQAAAVNVNAEKVQNQRADYKNSLAEMGNGAQRLSDQEHSTNPNDKQQNSQINNQGSESNLLEDNGILELIELLLNPICS